jgi:ribosomal protein L23
LLSDHSDDFSFNFYINIISANLSSLQRASNPIINNSKHQLAAVHIKHEATVLSKNPSLAHSIIDRLTKCFK